MPFTYKQICVKDQFVTEEELIDRFTGQELWMWGLNTYRGILGDNTRVSKSSPVQTISGGVNWRQIAVGEYHAAAIKTDGTLWAWGENFAANGSLGDNTNTARSSPVQTISGGTNWRQVSVSWIHTAAIKTDGTLWTWGGARNSTAFRYGQLGNNSINPSLSPVQTIAGGNNWKQVSAESGISSRTAAIKTDGTLWLWGYGSGGKLGNNSTAHVSSPVQTISGGTNWKQVSLGGNTSAAIKNDGTLWLWGTANDGALGNNTTCFTNSVSSPVQTISGGNNWKQVSGGTRHNAAIKTDGTLWLWGFGAFGTLGNNIIESVSSPVQTVSGGTNWKQVSAGEYNTAAIKTDGTLWLWGCGSSGALGNNATVNVSSPVQTITQGTSWRQVSVGRRTTGATRITEF